jgi:hypothetical protein
LNRFGRVVDDHAGHFGWEQQSVMVFDASTNKCLVVFQMGLGSEGWGHGDKKLGSKNQDNKSALVTTPPPKSPVYSVRFIAQYILLEILLIKARITRHASMRLAGFPRS